MKRTYTKPTLYAESFELCEHIASCKTGGSVSANYNDGYSCTYTDSNLTLFYDNCTNRFDYDTDIFPGENGFEEFLNSLGSSRGGCYNAFVDGNFFAS